MTLKNEHAGDNDSGLREGVEGNTKQLSDNVQLTATLLAEPAIVESLSRVHAAFIASTLSQQPLLDALELFDRCVSSVDWSSSNPNRDTITNYFTMNKGFLPAMVNLWGFSWEQNFQVLTVQISESLRRLLYELSRQPCVPAIVSSIVHTVTDHQLKTIYRILLSGRSRQTISTIDLITQIACVPRLSTPDMLYRLVVSEFNVWPKLLARKGSMREKEILKAAKKRKLNQANDIRTHAIKFLLVILENGTVTTKENMLCNRLLMSPLIKFLPIDPSSTILELLKSLRSQVLENRMISRSTKTMLFNTDQFLFRIVTLLDREDGYKQDSIDIADEICQFLFDACTTPGNGICFEDRGWYNKMDTSAQEPEDNIHNVSLFRLITHLHPIRNGRHRVLTLKILERCAELRAPYFLKVQFAVHPDLIFSFISTANFWREIISLPWPRPFSDGASLPDDPPPTATVLENIMPTILSDRFFINGLTSQPPFVRYTTCQLIFTVLQKIKELRNAISGAGRHWHEQLDAILESLSIRLPDSALIFQLCLTSRDHHLLATCSLKTLSLYKELLSSSANGQIISPKALSTALQGDWSLETPIDILNKSYLLNIIQEQTGVHWWSQQGGKQSILVALLRERVSTCNIYVKRQIDVTLEKLVQRSNAFQLVTIIRPLSQICQVLDGMVGHPDSDRRVEAIVGFIEQSLSRFMQSPYSFFDEAASLTSEGERMNIFSSVLITFARQWIYLRNKTSLTNSTDLIFITEWLCRVLMRLVIVGEDSRIITKLLGNMDKNCAETSERVSGLREDILRWVMTSSNSNNTLETSFPGDRKWTDLQNESLSRILLYLRTSDISACLNTLLEKVEDDIAQVTSFEVLLSFRRLVIVHSRMNSVDTGDMVEHCYALLEGILVRQEKLDPVSFVQSKAAILQGFCSLASTLTDSLTWSSKFLERNVTIHTPNLFAPCEILRFVPLIYQTTRITERLVNFWNATEKLLMLLEMLRQFSIMSLAGPNASYMVSCIEYLLPLPDAWSHFSLGDLKLMFNLGYLTQSSYLSTAISDWLDQAPDRIESFASMVSSCDSIWAAISFTKFEALIVGRLTLHCSTLTTKLVWKLSVCAADLPSVESILCLSTLLVPGLQKDSQSLETLRSATSDYLRRCSPIVERALQDDLSVQVWDILPSFILDTTNIDLEKWLGNICKRDLEDLNPKGSKVIKCVFNIDGHAFHRTLPGWIVRTFSRLTRRFAEDEILSETTLKSVEDFESLLSSIKHNEEIRRMIETKMTYVETLILAAITHHLRSVIVSQLLVTLSSMMRLSAIPFNEAYLLQAVLGEIQTHNTSQAVTSESFILRMNIASIVYNLFMINASGNSNESVLVGILGLYTGSVGPADRLLLRVMQRIDLERSLNIFSSSETWNSFREKRSRSHVEALLSSLQSPFALIDPDAMRVNTLEFEVDDNNSCFVEDVCSGRSTNSYGGIENAYRKYDPLFWLPIVAYCLEKVIHPSELVWLIDVSAIGYALVALSSKCKAVHKMAAAVLIKWEHLCEVHQLRERYQIKALMNAIRNSKFRLEELSRVPKLTAVFLARSLNVLMDPNHILYGKANSFFLQRPLLDLEDIPMFYALSNSGEHFEREVDWLLDTLIAGLDDASMSKVLGRRHVVEFCLGLYRARAGKYKLGRSQLPNKIRGFLTKLLAEGYLTESIVLKYGFGAWLRQEYAFDDGMFGDTRKCFVESYEKQVLARNIQ